MTILLSAIIFVLLNIIIGMLVHYRIRGNIVVSASEDGVTRFSLDLYDDPYDLVHKRTVLFKVIKK